MINIPIFLLTEMAKYEILAVKIPQPSELIFPRLKETVVCDPIKL